MGEITVKVKLFADLRKYQKTGDDQQLLRIPAGTTGDGLLDLLGIHGEDANQLTFGLNGGLGDRREELHDGDEVLLFSPMEGG